MNPIELACRIIRVIDKREHKSISLETLMAELEVDAKEVRTMLQTLESAEILASVFITRRTWYTFTPKGLEIMNG